MKKQSIKVEVIVFRLINGKYEYLLLKRIQSRGGFWQPITGGLEKGEALQDGVLREIKEEIGLTKIKKIIDNVHQFNLEKRPGFKEFVFGVEIDPDAKINLDKNIFEEHTEYKWFSYKKAMQLLKWQGNKQGLINLNKILEL